MNKLCKKADHSQLGSVKQSQFKMFWRQYRKNKGAVIGLIVVCLFIVMAVLAPLIWDYDTDIIGMHTKQRMEAPSWEHPFGTDHMGRDVLARVCYGARYSLMISVLVVGISFICGVAIGSIAGYFGGKVEYIIMRVVELFLMIPSFMLVVVFVAAFGIGVKNLILALGLVTVPHFTRIARASVLSVRGNEYVEAAKAIGTPEFLIILKHVIPNAMTPSLVQATTRFASAIIDAASFSFLGLGVPSPIPEWGAMLNDARNYMRENPYLIIFPGLAIMISVLAINLAGDGLRDALDPRLKK
jgi:peptide/nickel transport system permease protein